jgi:hypothetical protein
MQGDSIHVTLLVTSAFERLGIPYAVGRSLSSSVHGVMHSTLDVNIKCRHEAGTYPAIC